VAPVPVFFGMSEVHQVPGLFFLLLALVACGLAVRERRPAGILAAVLLLAFTAQLYPTLMLAPVLALLLLWSTEGWSALGRRPGFWLSAGAAVLLLALPAGLLARRVASGEGIFGPDFLFVLAQPFEAILPRWSFDFETVANVWLNPHFTPPLFALGIAAGTAAGLWQRDTRRRVLALLVCGLLCTWVGLVGGRINPARVQLPAAPFFALLLGVGFDRACRLVAPGRRRWWVAAACVAALAGSLAVWPGLTARLFTPQLERRVFRDGVAAVPDGCVVVWPEVAPVPAVAAPTYLAAEAGRRLAWIESTAPDLDESIRRAACVAYYRPSLCFDLAGLDGRRRFASGPRGMRAECEAVEDRLILAPTFVRTIAAAPDNRQIVDRPGLEVGFFRVEGLR